MGSKAVQDSWSSGDPYELFMGRWSRGMAQLFLAWLPAAPEGAWLDVGCGTGALSARILESYRPASILGLDRSAEYVAFARESIRDHRISFVVGEAGALPVASHSCSCAVSGLALNFFPEPVAALIEMARVVRPGGTVAAYVWDYAGRMDMLRYFWDAAVGLDPAARELDEGLRFPICDPGALAAASRQAGLARISVEALSAAQVFRDFDDYWIPFFGGQGPAPGYVRSRDPQAQAALKQQLRRSLPVEPDGSIHLTARAWAVQGQTRASRV